MAQALGASVPRHRLNMTVEANATCRCINSAIQVRDLNQRQLQARTSGTECRFYSFCRQTVASVCIETSQAACTQNSHASMIKPSFYMYSIIDSAVIDSVVTGSANID